MVVLIPELPDVEELGGGVVEPELEVAVLIPPLLVAQSVTTVELIVLLVPTSAGEVSEVAGLNVIVNPAAVCDAGILARNLVQVVRSDVGGVAVGVAPVEVIVLFPVHAVVHVVVLPVGPDVGHVGVFVGEVGPIRRAGDLVVPSVGVSEGKTAVINRPLTIHIVVAKLALVVFHVARVVAVVNVAVPLIVGVAEVFARGVVPRPVAFVMAVGVVVPVPVQGVVVGVVVLVIGRVPGVLHLEVGRVHGVVTSAMLIVPVDPV